MLNKINISKILKEIDVDAKDLIYEGEFLNGHYATIDYDKTYLFLGEKTGLKLVAMEVDVNSGKKGLGLLKALDLNLEISSKFNHETTPISTEKTVKKGKVYITERSNLRLEITVNRNDNIKRIRIVDTDLELINDFDGKIKILYKSLKKDNSLETLEALKGKWISDNSKSAKNLKCRVRDFKTDYIEFHNNYFCCLKKEDLDRNFENLKRLKFEFKVSKVFKNGKFKILLNVGDNYIQEKTYQLKDGFLTSIEHSKPSFVYQKLNKDA